MNSLGQKHLGALAALALLLRLPALFHPEAYLPAASPLGPLPLCLQPLLDAHAVWGWSVLGALGALADAASAVLIARLVERRRLADRLLSAQRSTEGLGSPGFWAGLAWAVNPVSLYLAGSSGAWQSLSLACLLWAAWDLEYSAAAAAEGRAALALGLAIAFALWPLIFLPLAASGLLSRRERSRLYVRALWLPCLPGLAWLFLRTPHEVLSAWAGPPSTLGLPGLFSALWSAAGAPWDYLQPVLELWLWAAPLALLGLGLSFWWRPTALLPGLALGAWVWALACPSLQGPLLLLPVGLSLLLPGPLAWRSMAACLPLLVLQDRLPGLRSLMLRQQDASGLGRGTHLFWAALLLAWLFWALLECSRLWSQARGPRRSSSYR